MDNRLRNGFCIDKKRRTASHKQPDPHVHDYYELYYMWEGECRYFLHDQVYHMKKGDFLLVPPGDHHRSAYDAKGFHDRCVIYFSPDKIDYKVFKCFSVTKDTLLKPKFFHASAQVQPGVQERMLRLHAEFSLHDEVADLKIHYLFQELVIFLKENCTAVTEERESSDAEQALEAAAKYITSNFTQDLNLEDVANVAGLTPTYFSKRFKELTGLGFKEYLNHIRLKQASAMLRESNLPINEIALQCGFTGSNYFGDVFRNHFGVSPREYRKQEDT
ncbi:MAG: AraC family transcriptional regulator [Lachnospiraceae bacterium]|nr:AraC family transcriptional regulator [Lachnospiraceae bacterium]